MDPQSMSSGEYTHKTLQGAQYIRVLRVISAPQIADAITCTIEQIKTIDNDAAVQHYEAVSWCWGDQPRDYQVRIMENNDEGHTYHILVSKHLYEALRALRYTRRSRYLWIDALCIDLDNYSERNQQVSKMSEIYGEAQNVCIWLGEGNKGSDMAMEFIQQQILNVMRFDLLCERDQWLDHWTALLDLMKRHWFQRKWIVQEVSLARKATVHCGGKSVDWKDFAAAVSLFSDMENSARKLNQLVERKDTFQFAAGFFDELTALGATRLVNITEQLCKKSVQGSIQRTATLEEIVAQLATFRTSEPRDNIYALLALAKDSQPAVAGIPDHLNGKVLSEREKRALERIAKLLPNPYREKYLVNYRQSIVDVYQQFVQFVISKSDPQRALDIICRPFASHYNRAQDAKFDPVALERLENPFEEVKLPSWISSVREVQYGEVKEWNPDRKKDVYSMERRRGDPFVSSPNALSYSAALGKSYDPTKIRFRKRSDHYSMYVEGFVLDRIEEVDPPASAGVIPTAWLRRGEHHKRRTGDDNAFWKTLVADRSPHGNALPYYKIAIEAALAESIADNNSFDTGKRIRQGKSEIVTSTLRQVQATIWERCLFETVRGRHLGLGPLLVEKGDLVVILYGCSVPVILREHKKTREQKDREFAEDEKDREMRRKTLIEIVKKVFDRKAMQRPAPSPTTEHARDPTNVTRRQSSIVELPGSDGQWQGQPTEIPRTAVGLPSHTAAGAFQMTLLGHFIRGVRRIQGLDTQAYTTAGHVLAMIISVLGPRNTVLSLLFAFTALVLPKDVTDQALAQSSPSEDVNAQRAPNENRLPSKEVRDKAGRTDELSNMAKGEEVDGMTQRPSSKKRVQGAKIAAKNGKAVADENHEPLPEYYTLIGESYVHDMMNGSAIQWQNDSVSQNHHEKVRPRIFELR